MYIHPPDCEFYQYYLTCNAPQPSRRSSSLWNIATHRWELQQSLLEPFRGWQDNRARGETMWKMMMEEEHKLDTAWRLAVEPDDDETQQERKPPSIILCSFSSRSLAMASVIFIFFAQSARHDATAIDCTYALCDRLGERSVLYDLHPIVIFAASPPQVLPAATFCVHYRDVAFLFCSLRAWTWFNYSLIGILLKFAFKETRTSSFCLPSTAPAPDNYYLSSVRLFTGVTNLCCTNGAH